MFKKINTENSKLFSYEINENKLFLKTLEGEIESVIFDFPIREVVEFKNKLLIRVEPTIGKILNENVFCYSMDGLLLWQVNSTDTIDKDCPYTSIQMIGDNLFFYNWSGERIKINPNNGEILKKEFTK